VELTAIETRQDRWRAEAAFFDAWSERADERALAPDPLTWRRYSSPRLRRRFHKEFRLRLIGDLRGRRVLDVGCGNGQNAALLARLGAEVTGIDVSAGAIRLAQRRAAAWGVRDRVQLICAPLETAALPAGAFDVVWGDAFLHHVLDELPHVVSRLLAATRPGGLLVFSEPVNRCPPLRRLRERVPLATPTTADERPLADAELELLRRQLPDLRMRSFGLLGRLEPFVLPGCNLERAAAWRRAVIHVADALDWGLLSCPGLDRLGGVAVLWGTRPQSPARM
jgi:2-polyprenyl-3-methyl-5-hydroxy-6-metoxy-1,4-benzoquinol methylase